MDKEISIRLQKYILHILDSNMHMPVLSDREHPLDDEISEYLESHIDRIFKDEGLRDARFNGEDNRIYSLLGEIINDGEQFSTLTGEIALILFDIMKRNVDIPSCDLVMCTFTVNNVLHMGLLKFNYRPSFIHYVHAFEEGRVNTIVKQKTSLPGESQKVDECAVINLEDWSIKLLEKKYEINGEKVFYMSELFLDCSSRMSPKEKAKIFKKATESFNKKYYEGDVDTAIEIKKAVNESLDRSEAIDIVEVAEQAFRSSPEMRSTYIEHVEKAGLTDKAIRVGESTAGKTFRRQRIKTDTGIEINIPMEYYRNNRKVEFINNIDGTVSILIKDAGKIIGM